MSICVVPIIGLILNLTPFGIKLEPVLYSVATFTFITSLIAWLRQKRLSKEERSEIIFHLELPTWRNIVDNKVLFVILLFAILAAFGTLSYVIATSKGGEKFTEFYVLDLEGKSLKYPVVTMAGKEETVTVLRWCLSGR